MLLRKLTLTSANYSQQILGVEGVLLLNQAEGVERFAVTQHASKKSSASVLSVVIFKLHSIKFNHSCSVYLFLKILYVIKYYLNLLLLKR